MSSPFLLLGNELPLHREVLAGTLHALRPGIEVQEVPATEVDAAVRSGPPWLVICSAPSRVVETLVNAWIVLHPDDARETVVHVAGERRVIPHPTMEELLAIIDEAWAASFSDPAPTIGDGESP